MAHQPSADNQPQPPLSDLLAVTAAARRCGLSASHLRLLVRRGEVWGIKLGRNWYTSEEAVRQYIARSVKPGPKPRADS